MSIIHRAKRIIKEPGRILTYARVKILSNKLLFNWLYKDRDRYNIDVNGIKAVYSTEDEHSKRMFYPKYDSGRVYERVVAEMMMDDLKNAKAFADVGAHLGYFSCMAAKAMPNGIVYSFEMDKKSIELLEKNIQLNGINNIKVCNYAVSDKEGATKFAKKDEADDYLSISTGKEEGSKGQSSNGESRNGEGGEEAKEYVEVKTTALDNFFGKLKIAPDVVKIDVEGAEMLVLKGMKGLMNNSKNSMKIYIELHGNFLPKFNSSSKEVISFLINNGYKAYEITKHRSFGKRDAGGEVLRELVDGSGINYNAMVYVRKG